MDSPFFFDREPDYTLSLDNEKYLRLPFYRARIPLFLEHERAFFHPDFSLAPNKFSLIFPGKRILASSIWEKLNEIREISIFPCFSSSYKKSFKTVEEFDWINSKSQAIFNSQISPDIIFN